MRFLIIVWIVFVLYQTSFAQFQDGFTFKTTICEGKDGALLPMFGTCHGYYICNNGSAVAGSCGERSLFNPLTLHCDEAHKVDCLYETKLEYQQSILESEEDEDEEDYEDEVEEVAILTTVRPTRPPKPAVSANDRICLGKKNGYALAKTDSCSEYYVCKSKQAHLRSCPAPLHFSPTRRICLEPYEAKCQQVQEEDPTSGPPQIAGFCSEEKDNALVSHATECGKFLLCTNMMFLVMDCPIGLHFNAETSRCDYPKLAKCQINKKKNTKTKSKKRKNVRKSKAQKF